MTAVKNRKLCWNCEGSVHIHATKCPFCSTDLTARSAPHLEHVEPLSPYTPPSNQQESSIPAPPYAPPGYGIESAVEEYAAHVQEQRQTTGFVEEEEPQEEETTHVLPLMLLLPGVFFLLFGLVLVLFAKGGELVMRWNAHYWFVYLIIAVPMLYFGWRTLSSSEE